MCLIFKKKVTTLPNIKFPRMHGIVRHTNYNKISLQTMPLSLKSNNIKAVGTTQL